MARVMFEQAISFSVCVYPAASDGLAMHAPADWSVYGLVSVSQGGVESATTWSIVTK